MMMCSYKQIAMVTSYVCTTEMVERTNTAGQSIGASVIKMPSVLA